MKHLLTIALLGALVACGPKKTDEPAAGQGDTTTAPAPVVLEKPKPDVPAFKLVNEAVDLLGDDASPADIQRAIALLHQGVDKEPDNAQIRLNLGIAKQRAGDLVGAQRAYQAAVGQDPELGLAWLHQGQILFDQGKRSQAESTWRVGMRKDPDEMALRVAVIDLLRTGGDTATALAEAKEALRENANSVEVYNAMGLCYQDQGDLVMARFVYQKALAGIPGANENAWLHLNLGWTYYLDGNAPQAVKELERALELDPYLVPALVNLSRIYMDDRNYTDTVPLLERALARAPKDPGVHMNLGIAYRGVGRFPDAEKQYREVMKLEPSNPTPWFNLGILFGDFTKDYDKAVEAFEQYVAAGGPDRERAEEYIALVKREQKRVDKRKKADEERKKREAEREAQKKLLEQQEKQKKKDAPEEPKKDADDAENADSPWGE